VPNKEWIQNILEYPGNKSKITTVL